jgi:putative ABC transport system permease protein
MGEICRQPASGGQSAIGQCAGPRRLLQAVTLKMRERTGRFVALAARLDTSRTSTKQGSGMNKLIFANLIHRPLRSVISVLAVAIEVVMILSIVAIFMGMLNDQKQRTNGIGADLVVSPSNASFMNGMSGAAMSAKLAPFLATLPHVAVAAPVIQNFAMGDALEILYGVDYKTFNALKPFTFIAGGPFQGPDDVIVDDKWAKTDGGHHVGETVSIQTLHHNFRICGIVESGRGGRRTIPIETLGALTGADGKASIIYIKSDDPANNGLIRQEIESTPGLQRVSPDSTARWMS